MLLLPRMGGGTATVPTGMVDAAIDSRPTLAMEQVAMVEELTTGGDGVAVIVAPAGAGKTLRSRPR